MIKRILSTYHPKYVWSLIYMLQATEYEIGKYLIWFRQVKDFRDVEKRKELVLTSKTFFLLLCAWTLLIASYVSAVVIAVLLTPVTGYILGVCVLLLSPYIVAYGIPVVVFVTHTCVQKPIEYILLKRTIEALEKSQAIKIAIAGSFGKTSMREILRTVLSESKKATAPPHSYNTPLGIAAFVKKLKGDEEVLIFELGEYYIGDIKKLCEIVRPDIGIITGVNEAHLEKFKTLNETMKTIFELGQYLGNNPVYVSGENELTKKNASEKHILYSRRGAGHWKVENPKTDITGTSFQLVGENSKLEINSKLVGLHQVGPLAVAADIGARLGLSGEQIQKGISKTRAFNHRLEPRTDSNNVTILDDSYNGNPDGVFAVIEFLKGLVGKRRFYVTPGLVEMGEKAETMHREIGKRLAEANIEKVILVKNSVTPYIEQGLREANYSGEIKWFDDALSMLSALPHLTASGDVVLLQNDWPDQYL